MAQINKSDFDAIYVQNAGGAAVFKDNTTEDIGANDMRDFAEDIKDSIFFFNNDAYKSFYASTSGTDTYTATVDPAISSYVTKDRFYINFVNPNTGAATLNLNGLGAKNIKTNSGSDPAAGDLQGVMMLIYNGTNFQLIGGSGGGGGAFVPLVLGSNTAVDGVGYDLQWGNPTAINLWEVTAESYNIILNDGTNFRLGTIGNLLDLQNDFAVNGNQAFAFGDLSALTSFEIHVASGGTSIDVTAGVAGLVLYSAGAEARIDSDTALNLGTVDAPVVNIGAGTGVNINFAGDNLNYTGGDLTFTGDQFTFTTTIGVTLSAGTPNMGVTTTAPFINVGSDATGDLLQRNGSGNLQRLAAVATGNVLISGGIATISSWGKVDLTTHITGDLPFANLAQGTARSVLAVPGNATADFQSVQGTADQVLLINTAGTDLLFSTIATGGITNAAVTYAKIQNVTDNRLLGNATGGAAAPSEISVSNGLTLASSALKLGGALTADTNISGAFSLGIGVAPSAKFHVVGLGTTTGELIRWADNTPTTRLSMLDNGSTSWTTAVSGASVIGNQWSTTVTATANSQTQTGYLFNVSTSDGAFTGLTRNVFEVTLNASATRLFSIGNVSMTTNGLSTIDFKTSGDQTVRNSTGALFLKGGSGSTTFLKFGGVFSSSTNNNVAFNWTGNIHNLATGVTRTLTNMLNDCSTTSVDGSTITYKMWDNSPSFSIGNSTMTLTGYNWNPSITGTGTITHYAMLIQSGMTGIRTATPTAYLHIGAGAAGANNSPLKLTSGTNLTTAETGAVEYNGTNLFFTRTGTTRENVWCGNDAATAPATNTIGIIADYYGTSATRVLTTPNSWASVNISGTTYKIPLYS